MVKDESGLVVYTLELDINKTVPFNLTHLSTEFAAKPVLDYPFGDRWSPKPGEPYEVADGVYWLRMVLPIALDHINLWILRDGDGWTIVDSGYDAPICEDVWEKVFADFLNPSDVQRVIVTHLHPDHIGLAAWLAHRCECPIWISRGEFDRYHQMVTRGVETIKKSFGEYVARLGLNGDHQKGLMRFFAPDDKPAERRVQESMCHFIADNDEFEIDDRVWRVVTGNGHSPEHSCLYCAELSLFVSGDQSIPRISSNVSVFPDHLDANPLSDWLDSCEKLRDKIPDDTLILPSHQEPFRGIAARMQNLIDDHNVELNRLRLLLATSSTVADVRQAMFARELNSVQLLLASGEALAHLNYLLHRNEIKVDFDQEGLARYQLT